MPNIGITYGAKRNSDRKMIKMSKYEENHRLLSDLKDVSKNIVDLYVAGANRNLKLSEYYILGSQCQI